VAILRLVWTLARTAAGVGGQFPSFTRWLEEHEELNIFDAELLNAAMTEATKIFFRGNQTVAPTIQK